MENIFEGPLDQFQELIDKSLPDDKKMSKEEYEKIIDEEIAAEFAVLDSKNQQPQTQQTQTEEKEITMNSQANETTAVAVAENNTKIVAKKVAVILGKVLAGAVIGGGLVVTGAHNHKVVNRAVKSARKKAGKVIPALAPKPWWKF